MKKILVTGAGGFIGSHLVEQLVENGYDVTAFVQYKSQENIGWLNRSSVKGDIRFYHGNVSDFDCVIDACKNQDTVFHLAALIGIPYSYVSPSAYIRTNIVGTYNVLEASRRLGLSKVVVTSTSEVYGSAQYTPIDEKHPLVGQSPYSASKIGADQLAISYYCSFSLPVTIVRPFNTYGPRQSMRAVIPSIICQAIAGSHKLRLGSLDTYRDFNFVEDTVNAFISVAESSEQTNGEVINIASQKTISISELVELIAEVCKTQLIVEHDPARIRPEKSEVTKLLGDATKILNMTKWRPLFELRAGLAKTVDWFRENHALYQESNRYHI